MKVGLNATCFNDRPSGARQRFIEIYGELFERMTDAEFVVYEPADCRIASWFGSLSNVFFKPTPIPSKGRLKKLINGAGFWSGAIKHEKFDIFEAFHLPAIKNPYGKTILTIHDVREGHAENPYFARIFYRWVLGQSIKATDHIVTVSESMENEILASFPNLSISVIYNGLDTKRFEHVGYDEIKDFRTKHQVPDKFILAVGHLEKRKNYLNLIDAIAVLRDKGLLCSLVIVGNDSGERKAVEARIEEKKLKGSVIILSELTDHELYSAFDLCSLFVFPSTYEGFGIPILEAMAAKRPMVLSNLDVFREITQNQGVYCPYFDAKSIASAIVQVITSKDVEDRLIKYGQKRIKDFSVENQAAQLEALYRSLIK